MTQQFLTKDGLKKVQDELEKLKKKRKEITNRIGEAVKLGDLSENAEYHEAKDAQGMNESKIQELETTIKNAEIIKENSIDHDVAQIGNTISVESSAGKNEYTIVGSNEADPVKGLISNESPMGSAFLGHKVGDTVQFETPAGIVTYKILDIK